MNSCGRYFGKSFSLAESRPHIRPRIHVDNFIRFILLKGKNDQS